MEANGKSPVSDVAAKPREPCNTANIEHLLAEIIRDGDKQYWTAGTDIGIGLTDPFSRYVFLPWELILINIKN